MNATGQISGGIKGRVQARLEELGMSPNAASVEAGLERDAVRNILRGRSKNPRRDTLEKLARVLDVSVQWLATGEGAAESEQVNQQLRKPPQNYLPMPEKMPQDVPVIRAEIGNNLGGFTMSSEIIDHVRRPPGIASARDVYALYVIGDSMAPRYQEGELVYVSETRPPRAGDYVIVQLKPEEGGPVPAFCRRLAGRGDAKLMLERLNPPGQEEVPTADVAAVHRILTMNELFGV